MRYLKSLLAGVVLCFWVQVIHAQHSTDIQQQWQSYHDTVFQEKVYVHTDKSTYLAGDIIWFSLYTVEASRHQLSPLSKVAYIEVLSGANKSIFQAKIKLQEGRGAGSVFLPLGAISGNYTLRAYTAWMKNFGADHFFEKPLTIINTLKNLEPVASDSVKAYAVQFFPEGGNLVNGLNKMAIEF